VSEHTDSDAAGIRAARLASIKELVLFRLRLFYREPGTMFWTFGFPMAMSIVLGIAFRSQEPEAIPCAVERGPDAPHVMEMLERTPDLKPTLMTHDEASQALRTGKVAVVVASPDGSANRSYRFDPTRPESRLARALLDDALQRGEGRPDAFTPKTELVTEPGSRYIDFLIPGLVGLGLMSTGFWGIGFGLAEMRTKRLLKRLIATPMRRSDFLLSFVLVRALLLFVELPPLLVFARLAFGVKVHGSYGLFVGASMIGALTFAAMGLLIASRSENPQMVSGMINLVSFPMYLGSGVFFSASRYPAAIQPIIHALPLTALIDAQRAIMLEGAGLGAIWRSLVILAAWGVLAFVAAIKLFKWR